MGNIVSYFFPQPSPASIEQVEDAKQEGDITEIAVEETVVAVVEEAVTIKDTETVELVEDKEIEAKEVFPDKQNDEGFEVVEENSLCEVNNIHQETNDEVLFHPELIPSKEESPGPAYDDVEETTEEPQTEVEIIGSIQETNLKLVKEEEPEPVEVPVSEAALTSEPPRALTPEPVKASTPEPPRALTPEPVEAPTPEPPRAPTPEPVKAPIPELPRALTPEPVKAPIPEPPRVLTPEPVKAPTPEPPRAITPEPVKAPTPEPPRALTPEPVKAPTPELPKSLTPEPVKAPTPEPHRALTPEPVKAPTPEPPRALTPEPVKVPTQVSSSTESEPSLDTEATSKDISSDVEVIEFSAEDDTKMAEEVPGGASGLRDILDEK